MIWPLELNVSLAALLLMFAPVGGSNVSVAPLTKLLPLMVSVWSLVEDGIEVGDTLLIDGAVREVGGTDHDKLRVALEKAPFQSVRGSFRFGVNHYPVQDFYLARVVKRPDGKLQTEIQKKILSAAVDPYAADCKMQ